MCTITWLYEPGRYTVFCNRDEMLTRKPGLPPKVRKINGVRYVAPADGDLGGTWIATNEHGLTLALVNRYPAPRPQEPGVSRGLLLASLMDCPGIDAVSARLERTDLGPFSPFLVAAFAPAASVKLALWDGEALETGIDGEGWMPLTSSVPDPEGVARSRSTCLEEHRSLAGGELSLPCLRAYHASHELTPGAYSVCMHRDDAATVSMTIVCVSDSEVNMLYHPDAPCRKAAPTQALLTRI